MSAHWNCPNCNAGNIADGAPVKCRWCAAGWCPACGAGIDRDRCHECDWPEARQIVNHAHYSAVLLARRRADAD